MSDLSRLFNPESIAVLDSQFGKTSTGRAIMDNCIVSGYEGRIHAVNINKDDYDSNEVYESCLCIKGRVDIAVVVTFRNDISKSLKDCVDKGLPYILLWPQEGVDYSLVEDLTEYANRYGSRIIGPGNIGLFDSRSKMQLCLSPGKIIGGGVSVVTYNASMGKAIAEIFSAEGLGISSAIALGEKIDVDEIDCLKYFIEDDSTKVVCMHLDTINHGDALWKQLEQTTKHKSVVVLCSEKSSSSGCENKEKNILMKELLQQCGAMVTASFKEAIDWCRMLMVTDRMWTNENKMF